MITDTNMTKPITDLESRLEASFNRAKKNPAAVALGSLGGKARAKKLGKKKLKEHAKKMVEARRKK